MRLCLNEDKIGPWSTGDVCVDMRAEEIVHGYMFVIFSLGQCSHFIAGEVEVGRGNRDLPRLPSPEQSET